MSARSHPRTAYRHGATFVDAESRFRVMGTSPEHRPDLWHAYLHGAQARYREHGVEAALGLTGSRSDGSSLVWLVVDTGGQVVAGLRVLGPLRRVEDAFALQELATSSQTQDLAAAIASRLRQGIVEIKGTWSSSSLDANASYHASRLLSRCTMHSLTWFGARWGICTAHAGSSALFRRAGARAVEGFAPVPFPDARYRTVPMWWDVQAINQLAQPDQLVRAADEHLQLLLTSSAPSARRRSAGLSPSLSGSQLLR